MRGKEILVSAILFGGLGGYAWWSLPPGALEAADPRARIERRITYYPNCSVARSAGVTPIYAGRPGYRPELDSDGDGIACEPYRFS